MLRALLGELAKNRDQPDYPAPLWKKMAVDQAGCTACGTCVVVCPTGALTQTREGSQSVRTFDSSRCTRCLLRQEACPREVIAFAKNCRWSDLLVAKPQEVARIDLKSCRVCGQPVTPAEGDGICVTCNKRQMG